MISYIIRRLLLLVPTIFGALSFLFILFFVLPGDPAELIAGGRNRAVPQEVVDRASARYGLDEPIPTQFVKYWSRTIRWDLGESYVNRRSVNEILGERAPRSIRLAFWAIIIEIVVGIPIGILSAIRRYSTTDKLTTVLTAAASAVPVFVLGYLLQYSLVVYPHKHEWPSWIPLKTSGIGPDTWTLLVVPTGAQWQYLVLPAVTLASVSTALAARMTRGSMLEVMGADYMRTARAKGLNERQIVTRHGLRNAMLPVVTLIGIDFGVTIGAAVLTETVFSWRGLGFTIADSVIRQDAPVLLGLTLVVVIAYALINLFVDVSYAWFDPRVRVGESN